MKTCVLSPIKIFLYKSVRKHIYAEFSRKYINSKLNNQTYLQERKEHKIVYKMLLSTQ